MMLTGVGSEGTWEAIHRIASPRADSSPVLLDMRAAPRKDGSDLARVTGPLSVCVDCWSVMGRVYSEGCMTTYPHPALLVDAV